MGRRKLYTLHPSSIPYLTVIYWNLPEADRQTAVSRWHPFTDILNQLKIYFTVKLKKILKRV